MSDYLTYKDDEHKQSSLQLVGQRQFFFKKGKGNKVKWEHDHFVYLYLSKATYPRILNKMPIPIWQWKLLNNKNNNQLNQFITTTTIIVINFKMCIGWRSIR